MLLNIEITEAEIQAAIERKVRVAIADQTNSWGTDNYIKEQVKKHWQSAVDSLVKEALENSDKLRASIATEIERKLKAQVSAAIKAAAQKV